MGGNGRPWWKRMDGHGRTQKEAHLRREVRGDQGSSERSGRYLRRERSSFIELSDAISTSLGSLEGFGWLLLLPLPGGEDPGVGGPPRPPLLSLPPLLPLPPLPPLTRGSCGCGCGGCCC